MQKSVFTISMYVVAQQRSPEKCIFMSCTYICHGYTKGFVMSSNFRPMVLNPRCRKNCTHIFLQIIFSTIDAVSFQLNHNLTNFIVIWFYTFCPTNYCRQFQFRNTNSVNVRNNASILLKIACIMHQFLVLTNFLGSNFLGI